MDSAILELTFSAGDLTSERKSPILGEQAILLLVFVKHRLHRVPKHIKVKCIDSIDGVLKLYVNWVYYRK